MDSIETAKTNQQFTQWIHDTHAGITVALAEAQADHDRLAIRLAVGRTERHSYSDTQMPNPTTLFAGDYESLGREIVLLSHLHRIFSAIIFAMRIDCIPLHSTKHDMMDTLWEWFERETTG